MSNDNRLIPRGGQIPQEPVPVSVRRPLAHPIGASDIDATIIPLRDDPPAPPQPHIIYINNNIPSSMPAPTSFAAGAVPTASPAPIHHHHYNATHQTTQRISYRIPVVRSSSALGMAALALGIIACVVCWVPWLGLIAVPVGTIGAVLGVLGVLVSLLFRKSSAGLPLTAVFICCLAAGISIASTRSLPYWQRQLDKIVSTVTPLVPGIAHSSAAGSSAPSAGSPAPASPLPSMPNWFYSSPVPAASSVAAPSSQSHVPTSSAPPGTPRPAIASKLDPSIIAARDQLAAAERACDQRTMQSPEYQSAVKAAADAKAFAMQLRQNSPGSSDLMQASRDMIAADNAVTDTLTRAQAADPTVIAARQTLVAARAAALH